MSIRILVADDAPFIREIVRTSLEKEGMEVIAEAINGNEAVLLAKKLNPDVILMDMVMPEKNGIEATEEILQSNPKQVVIAFSTLEEKNMMMKAIGVGCADFLVKPFEGKKLVEVIRRSLGLQAGEELKW